MVKKAVKTGVWTKVNYAEGEALNALSADFVGAVNAYRNNPTPETEAEMDAKNKVFKDAWKKIK